MRDGRVNIPCTVLAVAVMLFLMLPLVVVVVASFAPTEVIKFPPDGVSLKWYENIFSPANHFVDGLIKSLLVGTAATLIDIVLGVTASLCVTRHAFPGRSALLHYFTSPIYVPAVAFAFVLLQVYSQIGGVPGWARIGIGHLIIIMPYIVRNTVSVLTGFNWNLEDAATSLGASPVQVFFKVTLPVAKPGVLAGAILSFLYSFDEVALSGLLSTPKFVTLPVRIMHYMELRLDPTLAAISTLLIIGSVFVIVLAEKVAGLDMFVK